MKILLLEKSGDPGRTVKLLDSEEFQFPTKRLSLDPPLCLSLLLELLSSAASSLTSRERRLQRRLGEHLLMPRELLKRLEGLSSP